MSKRLGLPPTTTDLAITGLQDRWGPEIPAYQWPDFIADKAGNRTVGQPYQITPQDALDAIALLGNARMVVDLNEKILIQEARWQGVTWGQIGERLGYDPAAARQGARARWRQLANDEPFPTKNDPDLEYDVDEIEDGAD